MKLNHKGITLVESIITVAMIAILLSVIGIGVSSIVHYMGESALIKNKSHDIFEKIQNDEGDESTATMTFREDLSVDGVMKTITEKYNHQDELFLSNFHSSQINDDYNASAHFYLLINPSLKGQETHLSNFYTVNDDKLTPQLNSVLNNTQSSNDPAYIETRIKAPLKTQANVSFAINAILENQEYYSATNFESSYITWYKIVKKDGQPYDVFGVVEPYKKKSKNVTFTFKWSSWNWVGCTVTNHEIVSTNGFQQWMVNWVKQQLEYNAPHSGMQMNPDNYYFQHVRIFNNRRFYLEDLLDNSIFDELNDGEEIVITCYLK